MFDSMSAYLTVRIDQPQVREGNGRMKNSLLADIHKPPNVLMNLVYTAPGMNRAITTEVQIYIHGIDILNEHRYYEVR
jgi:hypothetical protein